MRGDEHEAGGGEAEIGPTAAARGPEKRHGTAVRGRKQTGDGRGSSFPAKARERKRKREEERERERERETRERPRPAWRVQGPTTTRHNKQASESTRVSLPPASPTLRVRVNSTGVRSGKQARHVARERARPSHIRGEGGVQDVFSCPSRAPRWGNPQANEHAGRRCERAPRASAPQDSGGRRTGARRNSTLPSPRRLSSGIRRAAGR